MKTTTILGPVALAAGVVTDGNITEVDMSRQGLDREFIITGKVVENATAPGAARTITVNYWWSDERVALTTAGLLSLAARKQGFVGATGSQVALLPATQPMLRISTASVTNYYNVSTTILRPLAGYLYISITKTTEDANSIPTLTLKMARLPSVNLAL